MSVASIARAAQSLRHFNRFYTAQIGVLDRYLLGSGRSLSEARVLYELAHSDHLTASDFVWKLGIDGGYLSRMLSGFEKEGLLERRLSEKDRRVSHLVLTKRGRAAFTALDRLSQAAAEALLGPLGEAQQQRLLAAMREIEAMLEAKEPAPVVLRPHRTGDMGWIVHRQAVLYAEEYGWDNSYEALVSEITGDFLRNLQARSRILLGGRAGWQRSSAQSSLWKARPGMAKLRLLYVEPCRTRDRGSAGRLVDECIAFARAKAMSASIFGPIASHRQRGGSMREPLAFKLLSEEPHQSFGQNLVGETWSLPLNARKQ